MDESIRDEDAIKFLIACMSGQNVRDYAMYGYDLYLPKVIRQYLQTERSMDYHQAGIGIGSASPPFLAAAWELCRRGVVRPGVHEIGAQSTDDGSGGAGFSVTPFGKTWLEEAHHDAFVPTEPERFGQMIAPYGARFGPGFHDRTQQAIRCYGAHAYLACCAMCGAAAESIILAALIMREKDEGKVLSLYASAGGRGRVEARLLGKVPDAVRREVSGALALLKYWRDEAAHGKKSEISDNEAWTSVAPMLRLAQSVNANWDSLTA